MSGLDEFEMSSRKQRRAMVDSLASPEPASSQREKRSTTKKKRNKNVAEIYRGLPEEYKKHQQDTEPMLHFVKEVAAAAAKSAAAAEESKVASGSIFADEDDKGISLQTLLFAAEKDVKLHQARIKASLAPPKEMLDVLQSYDAANDIVVQERIERRSRRLELLQTLQRDAPGILQDLRDISQKEASMTREERQQVQLARWQRALELYVYAPAQKGKDLDSLGLLEKLIEGAAEEEELSDILSQASQMCESLVDVTAHHVRDAAEDAAEAEDAYQIRLEAHSLFARQALQKSESIQSQFRTNGRAALQIGHQLEFAESKRRQCQSASILIRRWWMMESLAESEQVTGEPLRVEEEIRGSIGALSCKMDPLFTVPENSLEASKALKQLRAVCKSRGNAAASMSAAGGLTPTAGAGLDPMQKRRFDWTEHLISRTSQALESRLLNDFTKIYSRGGAYDFSANPRKGSIDWTELRELAQALLLFGSGKNLIDRYVDMVITSRFPELFEAKKPISSSSNNEFDMDATRSELSSLFHRVSDVCTAEFELIAHVFGAASERAQMANHEEMTLTVARSLLQRVISDPRNGLQARISDLLESIDRKGDYFAGAKKLDTFVVIHEKAAGLFHLLKEASEKMISHQDEDMIRNRRRTIEGPNDNNKTESTHTAVTALRQFLTSQEMALSSGHRRSYLNLELRLLHHHCCECLENIGCPLDFPTRHNPDLREAEKGNLQDYLAPVLPINKKYLLKCDILSGPLKSSVLRQPLIYATDSLARTRLMFGAGSKGGEQTARVIAKLYAQMCNFYGTSYLYPIVEALGDRLNTNPPATAPNLPFDENETAPDLGVPAQFWVSLEYVHTAAKSFDRELWAENRPGSARVWETLFEIGPQGSSSMSASRSNRLRFYADLEARGEAAIGRALRTLSEHIRWIIVSGGEAMFATGANRFFSSQGSGPYAIPRGDALETPNSPAVKGLCFCLRSQFVNIQAALTPQSLSAFWTALSMRLYDIFVPRLLQHYHVTTVGAVILSRDVESLRSVSMLAGSNHSHWDNLRELVTLYMTPPIALESMLLGPDGDINSGKGLFKRIGRTQSLVFMSRRADYRVKTNQGMRKATWVVELLEKLQVHQDPSDGNINLGYFAAERKQ